MIVPAQTSAWQGNSGLNAGILAWRVVDVNDNVLLARSTAGVREYPIGSGIYDVTFAEPTVTYRVIWDDGTNTDPGPYRTPISLQTLAPADIPNVVSTTTIGRSFSVQDQTGNAVVTDMQSVTLGDVTGTLGIVRTDTGQNVVGPGVALTQKSTGVYVYGPFNDPAPGLLYHYYLTFVTPAGITQYADGYASGGGLPFSVYFSYAAFVRRFGLTNVIVLSQKDNYDKKNPVPNWLAVQDAFAYADDEINSAFRDGVYTVPLDFTPNGSVIPRVVQNWAMSIAIGWLYESRGLDEINRSNTRFEKIVKRAYDDMSMYRVGLRRLNATLATNLDQSLAVVTTTDVRRSRGDNSPSMLVITDAVPIFLWP